METDKISKWEKEFHSKLVHWNAPAGSLLILHWEKEKEIIEFISSLLSSYKAELRSQIHKRNIGGHVSQFTFEEGQGEKANYEAGRKWGRVETINDILDLLK